MNKSLTKFGFIVVCIVLPEITYLLILLLNKIQCPSGCSGFSNNLPLLALYPLFYILMTILVGLAGYKAKVFKIHTIILLLLLGPLLHVGIYEAFRQTGNKLRFQ